MKLTGYIEWKTGILIVVNCGFAMSFISQWAEHHPNQAATYELKESASLLHQFISHIFRCSHPQVLPRVDHYQEFQNP